MKTNQLPTYYLSRLFPSTYAKWALKEFHSTKSPKKRIAVEDRTFYNQTASFKVYNDEEELRVFEMGNADNAMVLLIHDWNSNPAELAILADHLVRQGHYVLIPEMPAHGLSQLQSTHLIKCSEALRSVFLRLMPDNDLKVISSGFGGLVVSHLLSNSHFQVKQLILLNACYSLTDLLDDFSRSIHLHPKAMSNMLLSSNDVNTSHCLDFSIRKSLKYINCTRIDVIHHENEEVNVLNNVGDLKLGYSKVHGLINSDRKMEYRNDGLLITLDDLIKVESVKEVKNIVLETH